ncbi:hypothetical protein IscW_ISCW007495 [Ixodes scapularis]|uniref:Uncharacterized protein n=1 Tax=Ixodes scapularis TaxID=6945 RepID=B7PTM2_IXOSC|nr:hypothetical protein IscW_ISCW007495 [Ixodes scapularis]|eukprot:XP_002404682.1 hypothetical protein IscW_ISCW007495 [Ixodes scapularis]
MVRAVQDSTSCLGCLSTVGAQASSSPTMMLIVNIDGGGLSWLFVGLIMNLEGAAIAAVSALLKSPVQPFLEAPFCEPPATM